MIPIDIRFPSKEFSQKDFPLADNGPFLCVYDKRLLFQSFLDEKNGEAGILVEISPLKMGRKTESGHWKWLVIRQLCNAFFHQHLPFYEMALT